MKSNRRRDTTLELVVRRLLHRRGLRFRVDYAPWANKRNRADVVFTRQRVAVFLDGCFWHGCPSHYTEPATNRDFWALKVSANRARDARITAVLEIEGWRVLRFWEHESPGLIADQVESAVRP
jgi:DNA mismatch endonuclease (patch repair protein)